MEIAIKPRLPLNRQIEYATGLVFTRYDERTVLRELVDIEGPA